MIRKMILTAVIVVMFMSTVFADTNYVEDFGGREGELVSEYGYVYEVIDGEVYLFEYIGEFTLGHIPNEIAGKPVVEIYEKAFPGTGRRGSQVIVHTESMRIAESILRIGEQAFRDLVNLESVELPPYLKRIEAGTFSGCKSLKAIDLDIDSLEFIGKDAFSSCTSLKEVEIHQNVLSLGDQAFSNIPNMEKVIIRNRNMSFGEDVFKYNNVIEIHGYYGSTAEVYAFNNGLTFIPLDPIVNNPPYVLKAIEDILDAKIGQEISIPLYFYLTDGHDGDSLSFQYRIGNGNYMDTSMYFKYTPGQEDAGKTLTVTIRGFDSKMASVDHSFKITVEGQSVIENQGPIVLNPISDIVDAETYVKQSIDISNVFLDPDGDRLTYVASMGGDFKEISTIYEFIPTEDMLNKTNTIRIRAIDTVHGLWVEDAFTFTVKKLVIDMPPIFKEYYAYSKEGKIYINAKINEDGYLYVLVLKSDHNISVDNSYMEREAMRVDMKKNVTYKNALPLTLSPDRYDVYVMAEDEAKNLTGVKVEEEVHVEVASILGDPITIQVDPTPVTRGGASDGFIIITPSLDKACEYEINGVWTKESAILDLKEGTYKIRARELGNPENISAYSTVVISSEIIVVNDNKKVFKDTENHWGKNAVETLAKRGIINGKSEDKFAPNDTITRAEFVTLVSNYYALTSNTITSYKDVDTSDWYHQYVAACEENHLLPSIYGSHFEANKSITREEMMYILHQAILLDGKVLRSKGVTLQDFTDRSSISSYAIEGASYMVSKGIINGYNKMLNPRNTATRAEVAQMLYSLLMR